MRTMWPNDCCYPSPTDALIHLKVQSPLSCFIPIWPWLHALSDIHKLSDLVDVQIFSAGARKTVGEDAVIQVLLEALAH